MFTGSLTGGVESVTAPLQLLSLGCVCIGATSHAQSRLGLGNSSHQLRYSNAEPYYWPDRRGLMC